MRSALSLGHVHTISYTTMITVVLLTLVFVGVGWLVYRAAVRDSGGAFSIATLLKRLLPLAV